MLFEDDPARLGHPLHVETSNKQGACMLKNRCRSCRTLISYHNSSWIYAATPVLSHNTATPQDIAAAAAFASEYEANGELFPIYKQLTLAIVKKEPVGNVALM